MEFQEYTGWKKTNARKAKLAKIKFYLTNAAAAVLGSVFLYGMLWLGAFLDYVAGV